MTDEGAVGDGTTDDTNAFRKAILRLDAAGGGILGVPAGTYLVQPVLPSINGGIAVRGDDAVLRAASGGYQLLDIQGSNVTIAGVTLDGQNLLVRGMSIEAGSDNISVHDDVVENLTQPTDSNSPLYRAMPVGIKIYGNVDAVNISSTTVESVVAQRPECTAVGCTPVARGILISPSPGQSIATRVTISDSTVAHVAPKDDGDCIVIQDSVAPAALRIVGNTFDYCSKRAIKVQSPGVTVTDNVINNPFDSTNPNPMYASTLPQDMYAGISVYQPNVTVTDNRIGGIGTFFNGIEIGACQGINDVVVRDNDVSMGSIAAGSSLIRVMGAADGIAIENNTGGTAANGVVAGLSKLTNSTITDNSFTNVTNQVLDYSGC